MHHHYPRFYRGPSRLVWFAIGAAAATWFHKNKENMECNANGYCKTVKVIHHPGDRTDDEQTQKVSRTEERTWKWEWPPKHQRPEDYRAGIPDPVRPQPPQQPAPPMQQQWPPWDSHVADDILADMSKKASETLTELSSTINAFNAKLAEREKERREMERKWEEERRNPPKIV